MLWKCCTQYASKFRKLSSGFRTGKGQFLFQSQRKLKLLYNCAHFTREQSHVKHSRQASAVGAPRTPTCTSWVEKSRGTGDQIANIPWIWRKQENSRKTSTFASVTTVKPLTVWITTKWKPLTDGSTRPPYLSPEKPVCGLISNIYNYTCNNFKIGKAIQDCILSPCLFNFYAEYIMQNTGLDESQAGIKSAGKNTKNLRYADDSTLMAEGKEELKSLFMREKEESDKAGLKLNIQNTKIMVSSPITS